VTGDSSPPVAVEAPPPLVPPVSSQSNSVVVPSSSLQTQKPELPENSPQIIEEPKVNTAMNGSCSSTSTSTTSSTSNSNSGASSSVFASLFASSSASATASLHSQTPAFTDLIRAMGHPEHPADLSRPSSSEPISLCLATNHGSSIFGTGRQERRQYAPPPQPAMSATALLQKAAQMGAAATNASFLRGLGIVSSSASTSSVQQDNLQWGHQPVEPESASVPAGLGLGLPCDSSSGLKELMMGTPSMFGPKQTTLDFLGLGMAAGGTPGGGLSALITSIGGGLDVTTAAASFASGEFPGKDIGRRST